MTHRRDFPFIERIRVRWQEVDAQNVVFNGHYLTYVDVAISGWWRAIGMPYPDAMIPLDADIFVRHHSLSYHAPARLDDVLDVGLRCEHIGNSSLKMVWAVWCDNRLLVTGETVYVCTSLSRGGPMTVPEALRRQIAAHAAARPVVTVELGEWDTLRQHAGGIREAVFVKEQGIDASEEYDHLDAGAVHAVARNLDGFAVATGRLVREAQADGHAVIGRMAVIRSARGSRAGRLVFDALVAEAARLGVQVIELHAQSSARGFYEKAGFSVTGQPFDEVGIEHVLMTRRL